MNMRKRLQARIRKLERIQRNLKIELKLIRYAKRVSGKEMRGMTKIALALAEEFETQIEFALLDLEESKKK